MNQKTQEKAQALLDAAQEYYEACYEANERGAVRWLEDTDGRLLIFTRGEYKHQLLENIETLIDAEKITYFQRENLNEE